MEESVVFEMLLKASSFPLFPLGRCAHTPARCDACTGAARGSMWVGGCSGVPYLITPPQNVRSA